MISIPLLLAAAVEEKPNPLEHVIDKPIFRSLVGGHEIWWVSNVTVMLVLSGLVAMIALLAAARKIKTGTARTTADYRTEGIWANMVESTCVYLRNEVFRPVLGHDTDKFTPLLWTMFWFILICNLFGLVPFKDATSLLGMNKHLDPATGISMAHGYGGTATQSIFVTAALALIAFVVINGTALIRDPVGYVRHLTGGAPAFLWIIMIPVEILGIFVKPFALAMRLFANMTGGHVVVAVMLMFIKMMIDGGLAKGGAMTVVGFGGALLPFGAMIGIYFLEIVVAVIQAFVFTFLTCIFLGQLIHHDEELGHEAEHNDEATFLPGSGEYH